jgi:RHS repeat-associated protein
VLNLAGINRGNLIAGNQMVWRESYEYDLNGNRTAKTTPWGKIAYIYDKENRLIQKGDIAHIYDRDGNLLSEEGLRRRAEYRYNEQNRMVYSEVSGHTEKNRTISEFRYDGLGRRTPVRDAGGDAMRTLYDGTGFEVVREGVVFSDGRFTTRYSSGMQSATNTGTGGRRYRWVGGESEEGRTRVIYEDGYSAGTGRYTGISVTLYGRGEAVAVSHSGAESRGGTAYLGKDILGSVRSATNDGGSLEDRYEYDAFGKPYKGDLTTTGMNLGYTGKPYNSATGLYNYGYRDYKPEAARFTTVDPVRDGANWFSFVNNDPINYTDPFGLIAIVTNGLGPDYRVTIYNEKSTGFEDVAPGRTNNDGTINGVMVEGPTGKYTYKGAGHVDVSVVLGKDGAPTFVTSKAGAAMNKLQNDIKTIYNGFATVVNFLLPGNRFDLKMKEMHGDYNDQEEGKEPPDGVKGWWEALAKDDARKKAGGKQK